MLWARPPWDGPASSCWHKAQPLQEQSGFCGSWGCAGHSPGPGVLAQGAVAEATWGLQAGLPSHCPPGWGSAPAQGSLGELGTPSPAQAALDTFPSQPGASSACPWAAVPTEGQWQVLCPPGAVLPPYCSPAHPEEEGSHIRAGPPSLGCWGVYWRPTGISPAPKQGAGGRRASARGAHPGQHIPARLQPQQLCWLPPSRARGHKHRQGSLARSGFLHWSRVTTLKETQPRRRRILSGSRP